jgi:hypothetical protein
MGAIVRAGDQEEVLFCSQCSESKFEIEKRIERNEEVTTGKE